MFLLLLACSLAASSSPDTLCESDAQHELNLRRTQWLSEHSLMETTERVASVDNDVADLLSRGAVAEALNFAEGMPTLRLHLPQQMRDTSHIAPTWPQARVE